MISRLNVRARPSRPTRVGKSGGSSGGGGGTFDATAYGTVYAWYDASDTATITEASGAVSQWNDKSGNALHVTQTTASMKPTTNATTQNGLNVIDFDGGDWLGRATDMWGGTRIGYVAVYKSTADNQCAYAVDRSSSPNGDIYLARITGNLQQSLFAHDGGTVYMDMQTSSSAATGIRCTTIIDQSGDPNTSTFKDSGGGTASDSWADPFPGFTPNLWTVGARRNNNVPGSWLTGWLAEIIVYTAITDEAGLNAALDSKWGL